jgi:hypothetical protein
MAVGVWEHSSKFNDESQFNLNKWQQGYGGIHQNSVMNHSSISTHGSRGMGAFTPLLTI